MPSADMLVMGAGAVSLAGNFKEERGFPENGYTIVGATVGLAFLASVTRNTPAAGPAKAAAALMLLVACLRYIPGLFDTGTTKRKSKSNG